MICDKLTGGGCTDVDVHLLTKPFVDFHRVLNEELGINGRNVEDIERVDELKSIIFQRMMRSSGQNVICFYLRPLEAKRYEHVYG